MRLLFRQQIRTLLVFTLLSHSGFACEFSRLVDSHAKIGYRVQRTLKGPAIFTGMGARGELNRIIVRPAGLDNGIHFEVVGERHDAIVPATLNHVTSANGSVSLGNGYGRPAQVHGVEHLLSAFYGLGITNARVQVYGSEIPHFDGSASPFVTGLLNAGTRDQLKLSPYLRIKKPLSIGIGSSQARLLPSPVTGFSTGMAGDPLGFGSHSMNLTPGYYFKRVSPARKDLTSTPRFENEPARHRVLDAMGDMSLGGMRIEGELQTEGRDHGLHMQVLRVLEDNPSTWELVR